jgi:hypothetical protein
MGMNYPPGVRRRRREGRASRTEADLLIAAETVKQVSEDAKRGFPPKLDMPFGLAHLRKR